MGRNHKVYKEWHWRQLEHVMSLDTLKRNMFNVGALPMNNYDIFCDLTARRGDLMDLKWYTIARDRWIYVLVMLRVYTHIYIYIYIGWVVSDIVCSPPATWGLLDFMSVAWSSSSPLLLLLLLNRNPRRTVFSVGPQPRPSTPSVPCRTSTTIIPAQCSLPDLNHDHPRPVFPAGPQPRVSTPSVPCRTSCKKIWDKECAEES